MKYGNRSTSRKVKNTKSKKTKYFKKFVLTIVKSLFIVLLLVCCMGLSAGYGAFMGIIDNTPTINIESIVPIGFATNVYDAKGNHTDTLIMAGSNREEAEYEEIPKDLINAFVSIEDERFWQHKGIDTKSILRAVVGILRSDSSAGGGSTLTQQLIKNNVFDGGMEKSWGARIERKLQEQYLALELEKKMSKEMIITNYLNTINLGANTLGVKVAAKRYFNKDISDLTLSECAVVAGITKNPSRLNPITGKEANGERRKIILQKMFEQGYITKEEQESALANDVYDRIQNVNLVTKNQLKSYSYFTDELVEQVLETFIHELGYSETQAHNLLYGGGLSIYTTQDPDLQAIVDEEINNPDYYPEKRYSAEYRLSVEHANGETKHYSEETLRSYHRQILEDGFDGLYDTTQELEDDIAAYRDFILKEGDRVIQETTTVILQPQISFVLMDQATGEVKAINGGRGEKTASLTLNRATNTVKQPGSTFKILSAFAPAIDIKGDTLGTTYYDAPYTIAGKDISNWYSSDNYLGWSNIREGIIYSMNIVAVKTLMDTVTPEVGVSYAKDFGITTLTDTDFNPSTALGGLTKGVTNLELTNAFASGQRARRPPPGSQRDREGGRFASFPVHRRRPGQAVRGQLGQRVQEKGGEAARALK